MIPLYAKQSQTPFYFSLCKFYVAARGFERENRFYPAKTCHNIDSPIVSITPLSGPSVANIFASLMQRDRHPPSHFIWYKPYVKRGTSLA